jgi:hypothetical protein
MRTHHYTVTAAQVHQHARDRLQTHLPLRDHGPKCTTSVLWAVLFWAAGRVASLAAACAALRRAPSDTAVRTALLACLPAFAPLLRQLNRALHGGLPRPLTRRRQRLALDLFLLPYYGRYQADPAELYHGPEKAGTHVFHAYATAYVVFQGCRWTLALLPVRHDDPWEDIVRQLLRQVSRCGVRIGCVLLDRGFYCVEVVRYLQRARYPFLMPVIRRGRRPDHPQGASGTWVFSRWRRSGWGDYVLQDRQGQRARVRICVARVLRRPRRGRAGRARYRNWVYATWGVAGRSVDWVRQTYRRRFGIESSYRQLNQARIRTSTRDPLLRLLFVGLALVLRNVYVWLHWEVLARRRRGYRLVDLNQLPLPGMLVWLWRVIEDALGARTERVSERPMLN